jgi:P-type Mg2+ transporter
MFHASPELFHAGWFIESLATQILVILIIRTSRNPLRSRPSLPLLLGIGASLTAGVVIVLSPLRELLGFALLPPEYFAVLVVLTGTYLGLVELLKRRIFASMHW